MWVGSVRLPTMVVVLNRERAGWVWERTLMASNRGMAKAKRIPGWFRMTPI
jgi:hypothetical protein